MPKRTTAIALHGQIRPDVLIFLSMWPSKSAILRMEEMSDQTKTTWHRDVPFILCLVLAVLGQRHPSYLAVLGFDSGQHEFKKSFFAVKEHILRRVQLFSCLLHWEFKGGLFFLL